MYQGNKRQMPPQKKSFTSKGETWRKECIDAAIQIGLYGYNDSLRSSKADMKANYKLYDGIIDQKDIDKTVNPWGFSASEFPADMFCYPIGTSKVNLLVGEESKRRFDWRIRVTNDDAVSKKEKFIKDTVLQRLQELAVTPGLSEEQAQAEIAEIERWRNYEAQDIRERISSQILKHLWSEQKLKLTFNQGFKDALIAGEEIYCADIIGGKPILRKVNPLNFRAINMGNSPYIEDADILIEDGYYSIGWIIDHYYDELTPANIDFLEKGYGSESNGKNTLIDYPGSTNPFLQVLDGDFEVPDNSYGNLAYDINGNARVTRVVWKSMRKVGVLSYFDEETGELLKTLVDETYPINKDNGEQVKWLWINEWWEGTKIADNIYVKMQPRPIQFRRMDNLSLSGSGYVGTIYNTNSGKATSLMSRMKPYIYMYNKLAYRTDKAIAKYKGPMIELDLAKKPGTWDLDKWLYMGEEMGYLVVDSFNEGKKGEAQGKLAGAYNTTGKVYNPDMGNYISQNIELMRFIEESLSTAIGITRQREGAIDNRETVGGVERSVTQSSHSTEELFLIHDNTKLRALEMLLETAKFTYLNNSEAFQYIADSDLAQQIFTVDGELFNEADYGLVMTDSSIQTEMRNSLIQLAHAGIQSGTINFSTFMEIYMSDSIADTRRKIERAELNIQQRQQQAEQAKSEHEEKMLQMEIENREDMQAHQMEIEQLKSDTAIEVKLLEIEARQNEKSLEQPEQPEDTSLEREKYLSDYKIKQQQVDEDKRKNRAAEQLKEKEIEVKRIAANKKPTTTKSK